MWESNTFNILIRGMKTTHSWTSCFVYFFVDILAFVPKLLEYSFDTRRGGGRGANKTFLLALYNKENSFSWNYKTQHLHTTILWWWKNVNTIWYNKMQFHERRHPPIDNKHVHVTLFSIYFFFPSIRLSNFQDYYYRYYRVQWKHG